MRYVSPVQHEETRTNISPAGHRMSNASLDTSHTPPDPTHNLPGICTLTRQRRQHALASCERIWFTQSIANSSKCRRRSKRDERIRLDTSDLFTNGGGRGLLQEPDRRVQRTPATARGGQARKRELDLNRHRKHEYSTRYFEPTSSFCRQEYG